MDALATREIEVESRYQMQNANFAVRNIYDAAIELITNADDRYCVLEVPGTIEIEVERRRKGQPDRFIVRDFSDGMTSEDMDAKISRRGGLVSGMESGKSVRGTNSRGAKDIAAIGDVTFESIKDGRYHKCSLHRTKFTPYHPKRVTEEIREVVRIPEGTGTVVTIECQTTCRMPQHIKLVEELARLVPLRDIVGAHDRKIVVRDVTKGLQDRLALPPVKAKDRLKQTFSIPGYEGAEAKLVVKRADRQFTHEKQQSRLGGILVKSRHAIHESTMFDPQLEHDQHAAWFIGRLTCPFIDDLWNEYDDRNAKDLPLTVENPGPIIDPSRKSGLVRGHPFTKALFAEVLKRLRPLVEEERKRAEKERVSIENRATRQRLNRLQQAATQFMDREREDEPSRDPNAEKMSRKLHEAGYALNPPFKQFVKGETTRCWLTVNQEAFPEIEMGASVQIECQSDEISSDYRTVGLDWHPTVNNPLQAVWKVTAEKKTPATGIRVTVGPIRADATFEVFEDEKERYAGIKEFCFSSKRYKISSDGKRKRVTLYCPLELVSGPTPVEVTFSNRKVAVAGDLVLVPKERLGIAVCKLTVSSMQPEAIGRLTAQFRDHSATAEVFAEPPKGAGIKIKVEDLDLGNQRYRWRQNVLELGAKHPSLKRYLGTKSEGFPGQDSKHFRLLTAEIVADAVCTKLIAYREQNLEYEDDNTDWNFYYSVYCGLMTEFLPIAHQVQVGDVS